MSGCTCAELAQRDRFEGPEALRAHQDLIDRTTTLSAVPVTEPYANVGEVERWYLCSACGVTWRLVEPDPPFQGVWRQLPGAADKATTTEWTWLSFLFVYDTGNRTFPERYQITPADGTPYRRCEEALDGLVAEDAVEATVADLRARFPEPQYAVGSMNTTDWASVEANFEGMHFHWDDVSRG